MGGKTVSAESLAGLGPATGKISVNGFPNAMSGNADIKVAAGRIGSQAYDEIVAQATFNGSNVPLDNFQMRLRAGHIKASRRLGACQEARDRLPTAPADHFQVAGPNV